MNLRRAVLPLISLIALAYVATHSPVLGWIGRGLGLRVGRCYFSCGGWLAGRPVDMIAAWLLLAAAGAAAWWLAGCRYIDSSERPLAFGIAWLGLIAVPAALVGAIGWMVGAPLLRPPGGPLLASIPAVVCLAVLRRCRQPPARLGVRPLAGLA
ncbi:MAG TPA: hypothetical protein VFI77_00350, partial [Gemmatimonadales bacterium]|nr:hypothetical protein [Gemmatimonadales bacterium]